MTRLPSCCFQPVEPFKLLVHSVTVSPQGKLREAIARDTSRRAGDPPALVADLKKAGEVRLGAAALPSGSYAKWPRIAGLWLWIYVRRKTEWHPHKPTLRRNEPKPAFVDAGQLYYQSKRK